MPFQLRRTAKEGGRSSPLLRQTLKGTAIRFRCAKNGISKLITVHDIFATICFGFQIFINLKHHLRGCSNSRKRKWIQNFRKYLYNPFIQVTYTSFYINKMIDNFVTGPKQKEFITAQTINKTSKHYSLEIFAKMSLEDQKNYIQNLKNGKEYDAKLIQRMTNNKPKDIIDPPKSLQQFQDICKGTLSNFVKRKVQKSEYDELVERYKNSNQLWTDKDFPPNKQSFGVFRPEKPVVWKRISQVIPNAKFAQNCFSTQDIIQQDIGNCYLLSVISGIAQKPYRIKNIFPNKEINKNGIYMARMMYKGVYQEVIVDDFIPINPNNGDLYGAAPAGGKEIWVIILEKCWAKLCGSYSNSVGGLPNEVMRSFTSAPTYVYNWKTPASIKPKLWDQVLDAQKNGYLACCGTKIQNRLNQQQLKSLGLVQSHAYTILDAYDSPQPMLKIRNPWGVGEWKGKASEKDVQFWSKIKDSSKKDMDLHIHDDGIFFMLWRDFLKHFDMVDICKVKDNAHYIYQSQRFVSRQPIFYEIVTEGGEATFVASQKSFKQLRLKNLEMRLARATLILSKVSQKNTFEYVASNSSQTHSELYLTANLQKGKYVLCCFVQLPLVDTMKSTISIYTESNASFIKSKIDQADFLRQVFLDYGLKNLTLTVRNNSPRIQQFSGLISSLSIQILHLAQSTNQEIRYQLSQKSYEDNGLWLVAPFKGSNTINQKLQQGNHVVIVCRAKPGLRGLLTTPVPKLVFI